jgi:methionyl aminopeptidase
MKCSGADCDNEAGTLQCPTCLKQDLQDSHFCSQECFKRNWALHKAVHKPTKAQENAPGLYNPFPKFLYTGAVRPVYPLSPRREVPESIGRPDYAATGISKGERRLPRNKIELLDAAGQEAMRKVCRLGREVLDIVAAEVRPGVTTDYLDQVCHDACIERDVSVLYL